MSFQWRRFQFFDKDAFTDDESRPLLSALSDFPSVTASAGGPRHLVFGNGKGQIRILNRDYEQSTFAAFDGPVSGLHVLRRHPVLVAVGEEEQQPVIKFFLLDRADSSSGSPHLAKRLAVFSSKAFPPSPITCFSVLDDLSQLCLGCVNGQCLLLDGSLLKDKAPKLSYLIKELGQPITGLHYREDDPPAAPSAAQPFPLPAAPPSLFVLTADSVASFYTKLPKPSRIELESGAGAAPLCSALSDGRRLVVGRKEAVFTYEAEERSEVFAFEGAKKQLAFHSSFLVVVTDGVREAGAAVKEQLTLYDLRNKFIAYQVKSDPVVNVLPAFGSLFTLTAPSSASSSSPAPVGLQLQHYVEKDLSSKMDILFKKNLYPIAIALAASSASAPSVIVDIYQQYGDHMYAKGDYDAAISQYIATIGFTEPSYVIRRFLDAQRIHNLTRYLQALHEKGRANSQHTTLLLNCYTKLKLVDKLNDFVRSDVGWQFDVVTAITVCRQAAYYEHALFLAQRHLQHDLYIRIQLEDVSNPAEALSYIRALPWQEADAFISRYGKRLVTELPEETTQVLMQLCTRWVPAPPPPGSAHAVAAPAASASEKSAPERFVTFFVDHPGQLQAFLEQVQHEPQCSTVVYNTLLELYLRRGEEEEGKGKAGGGGGGAGGGGGGEGGASSSSAHPFHHQIMQLLKSFHGKYDMDHALVLCKLYQYERGILYLYAKLHYFAEILQHHIEHGQHARIISVCIKYGATLPSLWVQALQHFAQLSDGQYEDEITQVLEVVERMNLLAPLMVIQILAGKPVAGEAGSGGRPAAAAGGGKPISVIQDYIVKLLRNEQSIITRDAAETARYLHETAGMKEEIARMTDKSVTFQVGKCAACASALSLPAVHFLCKHSYHLRCCDGGRGGLDAESPSSLSASAAAAGYECIKCAAEYRKVREIKDSLRQSAQQHDRFFKQLDDSADGFATVADYFGRGVFDDDAAGRDKANAAAAS